MAGFGGSASLALLSGIFTGANKAEEATRTQARENLLNEQTQAQIDESHSRTERLRRQAKDQRIADERNAAEAQADEAAENTRFDAIAGMIMQRSPEMTPEEAGALAREAPAGTLNQFLQPDDIQVLSDLDAARLAEIEARTAERERENSMESRVSDLTNSPEGLRIRGALVDGDRVALELAIASARGSPADGIAGHDEETILAYIDAVQPKDDDGVIRLTDSQKSAARVRGTGMATSIVQRAGSIEAAIAAVTNQILTATPDNPFDEAQVNETLRALERMKAERDRAEAGMSDFDRQVAESISRGN